MPDYFNLQDWHDRGNVIITPKPFYRRLPFLRLLPYRVGDTVEFHIHIDTRLPRNSYEHINIYEYFGNGKPSKVASAEKTEIDFKGTPIRFTGDVVYAIGDLSLGYSDAIFSAYVESRDQILSKAWWFVLGALVSLACVVIAWLLKLIPAP